MLKFITVVVNKVANTQIDSFSVAGALGKLKAPRVDVVQPGQPDRLGDMILHYFAVSVRALHSLRCC